MPALRLGLAEGHSLPVILDITNSVLPAVKDTEMDATVAPLRSAGAGSVEYTLAGHLPILQYRVARKLVKLIGG